MSKTVIALFDEIEDARHAVKDLRDSPSFSARDISMMANDASNRYSRYMNDRDEVVDHDDESQAAEGAKTGAGVGAAIGAIGGLLVGLGLFAIPGVGPVVAAGPLATTLIGAAGGAAAGGLVGALIGAGIPEERAHLYAEGLRRGGTLVVVRANDSAAEEAVRVMSKNNPVDIEKRAEHWRSEGWEKHNHEDEDYYTTERLQKERSTYKQTAKKPAAGGGSASKPTLRVYDYNGRYDDEITYASLDHDFRNHFTDHPPAAGGDYDQWSDAYRFGAELGRDNNLAKAEWNDAEAEAHKRWAKSRDASSWDKAKNYVQYGWHKAKSEFHDARTPGNRV